MRYIRLTSTFALILVFCMSFTPSVLGQTSDSVVEKRLEIAFLGNETTGMSGHIDYRNPSNFTDNRELWQDFSDTNNITGRVVCSSLPPMIYRLPIPFNTSDCSGRVIFSSMVSIDENDFAGGASDFWVRMPLVAGEGSRLTKREGGSLVYDNSTVFLYDSPYFSVFPDFWESISVQVSEVFDPYIKPNIRYEGGELRTYPLQSTSYVGGHDFNLSSGYNVNESKVLIQQNVGVFSSFKHNDHEYNASYVVDMLYVNCKMPLYNGHRYLFTWTVEVNEMYPYFNSTGLYFLFSTDDMYNDGSVRSWFRWNESMSMLVAEADLATEVMGVTGMAAGVTGLRLKTRDYIYTEVETAEIDSGDSMVFAMPFLNSTYNIDVTIDSWDYSFGYSNRGVGSWFVDPDNDTYFIFPFNYTGTDDMTKWRVEIHLLNGSVNNTIYLYDGDMQGDAKSILNLTSKSFTWYYEYIPTGAGYYYNDSFIWFRPYFSLQETEALWNNTDLQTFSLSFSSNITESNESQEKTSFWENTRKFLVKVQTVTEAMAVISWKSGQQGAAIGYGAVTVLLYLVTGEETGPITRLASDLIEDFKGWINNYIITPLRQVFTEIVGWVLDIVDTILIYVDTLIDMLDTFLKIILVALVLAAMFIIIQQFKKMFRFSEILGLQGGRAAMLYASNMFDEAVAKVKAGVSAVASVATKAATGGVG